MYTSKRRERLLRILCSLLIFALLLPALLQQAEAAGGEPVKIGYYENEVFQEGAREGAVRTGYATSITGSFPNIPVGAMNMFTAVTPSSTRSS